MTTHWYAWLEWAGIGGAVVVSALAVVGTIIEHRRGRRRTPWPSLASPTPAPYPTYAAFRDDVVDPDVPIDAILARARLGLPEKPLPRWEAILAATPYVDNTRARDSFIGNMRDNGVSALRNSSAPQPLRVYNTNDAPFVVGERVYVKNSYQPDPLTIKYTPGTVVGTRRSGRIAVETDDAWVTVSPDRVVRQLPELSWR